MTGTFFCLAWLTSGATALASTAIEHQHVGALGERRLDLLLLLGRVLVGVAVEELAVGAERLDLGLEQRPVEAS